MEYEYQLWRHKPSGERYAVRMLPYVPAEERGGTAGTLYDQQYEASLIDAMCGPLYAGSGHSAMRDADLGELGEGGDCNYSSENVAWLREHHMEFARVDTMGTDLCLLCGGRHEQPVEEVN